MSIIECMIFKDSTILVNKDDNSKIATDIDAENQEYVQIMAMISYLTADNMGEVLKSYQIFTWKRRNSFCGVCGSENCYDTIEDCMSCSSCKERFYPAQFPAVIVSIVKDGKILLAHNSNFPGDMHSVLAGFVDLGENLEDAVVREIREEVGLEVKNIKYYASQNWGFTSSLMIAFTAEWESGEIKVDGIELDKADWFDKDQLPEIPPTISIARSLIDSFS